MQLGGDDVVATGWWKSTNTMSLKAGICPLPASPTLPSNRNQDLQQWCSHCSASLSKHLPAPCQGRRGGFTEASLWSLLQGGQGQGSLCAPQGALVLQKKLLSGSCVCFE